MLSRIQYCTINIVNYRMSVQMATEIMIGLYGLYHSMYMVFTCNEISLESGEADTSDVHVRMGYAVSLSEWKSEKGGHEENCQ